LERNGIRSEDVGGEHEEYDKTSEAREIGERERSEIKRYFW